MAKELELTLVLASTWKELSNLKLTKKTLDKAYALSFFMSYAYVVSFGDFGVVWYNQKYTIGVLS